MCLKPKFAGSLYTQPSLPSFFAHPFPPSPRARTHTHTHMCNLRLQLDKARTAANSLLSGGPASPGLAHVVAAIDHFRAALARSTGRPLLEEAELQLLGYKAGGSYRRHCDDAPGLSIGQTGRQVRRSVSVLVYLTDDDWSVERDGGALRVFPPKGSSGPHVDVPPLPGSLVVFDSATIPHEVLTTHRPRIAVAGWLQEARDRGP